MKMKRNIFTLPLCFVCNIVLVYIIYMVCRLMFLLTNWSMLCDALTWSGIVEILHGAWYFDTSAILYTNALYALLMLFPIHYKELPAWQDFAKGIFVLCNSVCIITNLADCVYFKYTMRRTTATVFSEFKNENNLGSVFGAEIINHWYLVAIGLLLIYALIRFYVQPSTKGAKRKDCDVKYYLKYYALHLVCLLVFIPLCVAGMRGGFTTAVRPITISNANQYVDRPTEAALVLNTPFSLIRTIDKPSFVVPDYYTPKQLDAIYSPVHKPATATVKRKKNVVVIIIESFGREYIGGYNKWLEDGKYKGYTPFVDSLMRHSATYL